MRLLLKNFNKKLINYSKKPIFFSVTDAKSVYNETKIILKKDSGIFLKGAKKSFLMII